MKNRVTNSIRETKSHVRQGKFGLVIGGGVALTAMFLAVSGAWAQTTYTWNLTPAGNSPITDSANWNPTGGPPGSLDSVIFDNTSASSANAQVSNTFNIANFTFNRSNGQASVIGETTPGILAISGNLSNTASGTPQLIFRQNNSALSVTVGGNMSLSGGGTTRFGANNLSSTAQSTINDVAVTGTTTIGSSATLTFGAIAGTVNLGNVEISGILNPISGDGGSSRGTTDGGTNVINMSRLHGNGTITGAKASPTLVTTGILSVSGSVDGTFSGTISNGLTNNVLALSKAGASTLTLSGNNSFTGQTTISGGTVLLSGAGNIGSTTIGFGVTNVTSGVLQIDNSYTFSGSLNFNLGSVSVDNQSWNLFTGSGFGPTDLTISSITSDLGSFAFSSGTWNLTDVGGRDWSFDAASGQLAVVPEPSTWIFVTISLFALTILRRRRA